MEGFVPAVAGSRLLAVGQRVEYLLGFSFTKTLRSIMGWMLIPSGAFSAFKRKLVENTYVADTLAEDFDLGLTLIERGYRLGYARDAVAETLAPGSLSAFTRQRIRWSAGGLQVLAKHRKLMLNPSAGIAGLIGVPVHFIVGYVIPLMEYLGYFLIAAFLAARLISLDAALILALWLLLLKLYSTLFIVPPVVFSWRILGERVGPLEVLVYWFVYYYLLLYTTVMGIYAYLSRISIAWGRRDTTFQTTGRSRAGENST